MFSAFASAYWSSTSNAYYTDKAWIVIDGGFVNGSPKADGGHVRALRGP